MAILKILKYPNKNLRIKANFVKKINSDINQIINDMFDTMYYYNGIGLSATQVNIHKQIFITDILNNKKNKLVFINPKIEYKSEFIYVEEGCLSIPNFFNKIKRYKNIHVKFIDLEGNKILIKAKNLLSSCIQHEMDHLLGILIKDYI